MRITRPFTSIEVLLALSILATLMFVGSEVLRSTLLTRAQAYEESWIRQKNSRLEVMLNSSIAACTDYGVYDVEMVHVSKTVFQPCESGMPYSTVVDAPNSSIAKYQGINFITDSTIGDYLTLTFYHEAVQSMNYVGVYLPVNFIWEDNEEFRCSLRRDASSELRVEIRLYANQDTYYVAEVPFDHGDWNEIALGKQTTGKVGTPGKSISYVAFYSFGNALTLPGQFAVDIQHMRLTEGTPYEPESKKTVYGNCLRITYKNTPRFYIYDSKRRAIVDGVGNTLSRGIVVPATDEIPSCFTLRNGYPEVVWRVIDSRRNVYDFQAGGEVRYAR